MDIQERLRSVPLFTAFSEKQIRRIADAGKQVEFPEGRVVAREDQSGEGFHVILEGRVSVHVHGEERATLGPGQFFGEMSLIDGKPRSATVTVIEPTTTFSITSWEFHPLLNDVDFTKGLLAELAARIRASERSPTH
jgi:CRP/FNR family transcriptional regulator/CRP/FNR family cyclic AMP-dependent transcriptional regulator